MSVNEAVFVLLINRTVCIVCIYINLPILLYNCMECQSKYELINDNAILPIL